MPTSNRYFNDARALHIPKLFANCEKFLRIYSVVWRTTSCWAHSLLSVTRQSIALIWWIVISFFFSLSLPLYELFDMNTNKSPEFDRSIESAASSSGRIVDNRWMTRSTCKIDRFISFHTIYSFFSIWAGFINHAMEIFAKLYIQNVE